MLRLSSEKASFLNKWVSSVGTQGTVDTYPHPVLAVKSSMIACLWLFSWALKWSALLKDASQILHTKGHSSECIQVCLSRSFFSFETLIADSALIGVLVCTLSSMSSLASSIHVSFGHSFKTRSRRNGWDSITDFRYKHWMKCRWWRGCCRMTMNDDRPENSWKAMALHVNQITPCWLITSSRCDEHYEIK